jgi:hypothetical protein
MPSFSNCPHVCCWFSDACCGCCGKKKGNICSHPIAVREVRNRDQQHVCGACGADVNPLLLLPSCLTPATTKDIMP